MKNLRHVYSVIERIPVDYVKQAAQDLPGQYFTEEELRSIAGKPARTIAGLLAVKKALVRLCAIAPAGKSHACLEKSFTIIATSQGAPVLKTIPPVVARTWRSSAEDFHISITHTKFFAYGLAAFQEKGDV
jgi:phosphopantetheinyl transferase (holo-ACP synthase)